MEEENFSNQNDVIIHILKIMPPENISIFCQKTYNVTPNLTHIKKIVTEAINKNQSYVFFEKLRKHVRNLKYPVDWEDLENQYPKPESIMAYETHLKNKNEPKTLINDFYNFLEYIKNKFNNPQ